MYQHRRIRTLDAISIRRLLPCVLLPQYCAPISSDLTFRARYNRITPSPDRPLVILFLLASGRLESGRPAITRRLAIVCRLT